MAVGGSLCKTTEDILKESKAEHEASLGGDTGQLCLRKVGNNASQP
jgi:hypothetical protein